jgi:hypothetical protein
MTHHKDKVDVYCFATKHGEDDAVTSTVTKVATYADLSTSTVSHIARMMRDECKIDLLIDLQDRLQDAGWIWTLFIISLWIQWRLQNDLTINTMSTP